MADFSHDFSTLVADAIYTDPKYLALWRARAVADSSDGRVDVMFQDVAIGGKAGLQQVRLREGIPGTSIDISRGTDLLVGFEGGDPSEPFALAYLDGTNSPSSVTITVADGGSLTIKGGNNSVIKIESGDVRLGDNAGKGLARQGDMVVGQWSVASLTLAGGTMAGAATVAPTMPVKVIGKIVTASSTVKGA